MKTIKLEVGVKAFIKQNGKYLFLKRSKAYPGGRILRWDIPGGRINPGESLLKALKREIKEETNLRLIKINKILAVQDILRVKNMHTVRITYSVQCEGDVIINPKEHIEYKWLSLREIKSIKHDIYLTPVIKILDNFLLYGKNKI